jgi:hypothetical protein
MSWPGSVHRRHGLGTTFHAEPFQCSMSVPGADVPALPTAHALVLEKRGHRLQGSAYPGVGLVSFVRGWVAGWHGHG